MVVREVSQKEDEHGIQVHSREKYESEERQACERRSIGRKEGKEGTNHNTSHGDGNVG